ncbi:MAG: hypothetical protein EA396_03215 [Anaerolineaceae bacterium]|nr:MAG: hypothetical protein EA396_03215 [Anaerolineaceae bacterium]
MEISFQLKTLEPLKGAWDILRMFGNTDSDRLPADQIMQTLDLSERVFNKAMRRLVTKGYVQMDGSLIYRVTENGGRVIAELLAYDEATGGQPTKTSSRRSSVSRRMMCAVPVSATANQPAPLFVGFHPGDVPDDGAEVVVRVTVLNGQPDAPEDMIFALDGAQAYQIMTIVPGLFDQVRLRLEAYQLGEMGDVQPAGGMYVDLPVTLRDGDSRLTAYGADIQLLD